MTPLPPTPSGVVRFRLIHQVGADIDAESSLYFSYTGAAVTLAGLNAAAAQAATLWSAEFAQICHSTTKLVGVVAIDLQNPTNPVGSWSGSTAGILAGVEQTAETCVLFNMHIARRYRGGHPRIYFPAGDATQLQDPQTWTSGFKGQCDSAMNTFISQMKAWAGPPVFTNQVTVSYHSGSTWHQNTATGAWRQVPTLRATPLVDTVTAVSTNPKPGSQRRRMLR